jgi:hypothetical protein
MARDYKQEYQNYHSRPEQIKKRASRNAARRAALKSGKVKKGDNLDVHHKNGNPLDNSASNLRAVHKSKNRSFARTKTARKARA